MRGEKGDGWVGRVIVTYSETVWEKSTYQEKSFLIPSKGVGRGK